MKKWLCAAAAATGLSVPAAAQVLTLQGVSTLGTGDYQFTYQGTIGPDEGLRSGDRLIIYDFGGYIAGSISSPYADVIASIENMSMSEIGPLGFNDDPNVANLVFTYVGADFRADGGPFDVFEFDGLTARSEFSGVRADGFFAVTTKNNPDGVPGGTGTAVYSLGSVGVPSAVPEPAAWAMMLAGFSAIGGAVRLRRKEARAAV